MSVLCLGELLIDFVCTDRDSSLMEGENFLKKVGGAPLNSSVAIQKLGGTASMCGAVGDDQFGELLIDTLDKYGVDTKNVVVNKNENTTIAFVSLDKNGERDFTFNRGADINYDFSQIDEATLKEFEIFHFGSATAFLGGRLKNCYDDALNYAREHNKTIIFDPNYREALYGNNQDSFINNSVEYIKYCDVLKVSDEEATLITKIDNIEESAAKLLELGAKNVLITLGKDGTLFASSAGIKIIKTTPVKMVDATGAGDAFLGAVISKIQKCDCQFTSDDMAEFVEFGNMVAARTVTKYGALTAIPYINELDS